MAVHYSYVFEPYFMARASAQLPLFDEWYRGVGWDKNSYFLEACTASPRPLALVMLPQVFILNRPKAHAGAAGGNGSAVWGVERGGAGVHSAAPAAGGADSAAEAGKGGLPGSSGQRKKGAGNRASNSARFWNYCKVEGLTCVSRCTVFPSSPAPTPDARAIDYAAERSAKAAAREQEKALEALRVASGGKSTSKGSGGGGGQCRIEEGIDYFQGLNPSFSGIATPAECCELCSQYEACGAWSHVAEKKTCWLKANAEGRKAAPGVVSGTLLPAGGGTGGKGEKQSGGTDPALQPASRGGETSDGSDGGDGGAEASPAGEKEEGDDDGLPSCSAEVDWDYVSNPFFCHFIFAFSKRGGTACESSHPIAYNPSLPCSRTNAICTLHSGTHNAVSKRQPRSQGIQRGGVLCRLRLSSRL